jgi:hypothetical protein
MTGTGSTTTNDLSGTWYGHNNITTSIRNYDAGPITFNTHATAGSSPLTRMTILSNGDIGMRTSTPAYELQLVGDAAKSTGTAWINTSDIRTKKNITPFSRGLDTILNVNPVYF